MIFRIYDSKRMDMYIQTIRQNQLARFRNVSWHVYIIYLFIPCRCRRGYIFTRYCRTLSNVSQIIWTGFFSIVNICMMISVMLGFIATLNHDAPSNGNIFRVTGPLWGEFTGHRWIPLKKASDAELWYFLWSAPEQTVSKQSRRWWIDTPLHSSWRHCNVELIIVFR